MGDAPLVEGEQTTFAGWNEDCAVHCGRDTNLAARKGMHSWGFPAQAGHSTHDASVCFPCRAELCDVIPLCCADVDYSTFGKACLVKQRSNREVERANCTSAKDTQL